MCEVKILKRRILDVLDNRIKSFDKGLLLISDEKLGFKPTIDALSVKDLALHVYQCILVVTGAIKKGDFTEEDYNLIPIDISEINSTKELVEYGKRVKAYAKEVINNLTKEDLNKTVKFSCWGGFTEKIGLAVETIAEELFHHRGQLCTYLRMMEIKPPSIYDYT
ncbi:MAG: DinB family protein [Candidatus Hodarchaeota archaeon]